MSAETIIVSLLVVWLLSKVWKNAHVTSSAQQVAKIVTMSFASVPTLRVISILYSVRKELLILFKYLWAQKDEISGLVFEKKDFQRK